MPMYIITNFTALKEWYKLHLTDFIKENSDNWLNDDVKQVELKKWNKDLLKSIEKLFEQTKSTHQHGSLWSSYQATEMSKFYDFIKEASPAEPQPATTAAPDVPTIPEPILQALEQKGIITQNPLDWKKSKSLLAYFVVGMCEKYNLKHGQNRQIQPFATMFNTTAKNITVAINDIKKTGVKPVGHEVINEILKLSKNFFDDIFLNDK
jgi:hypothetical protein